MAATEVPTGIRVPAKHWWEQMFKLNLMHAIKLFRVNEWIILQEHDAHNIHLNFRNFRQM